VSEWPLQWRTVRARTALALSLDLSHGLSALPSHEELVAHSAHHPHLHLSLFSLYSLSLFPLPFFSPSSPLLYFSFLSKRRKGLVLTFSSPPPPPPPLLLFLFIILLSDLRFLLSPLLPPVLLCVRFLLFAWGLFGFRHCRYYISCISNLSQKYGFCFCFFCCLGLIKFNSFFLFSKIRHGMSLGTDFGVWQMMVQHLLVFWRESLKNHDVL
jgi:hypothetical protein